MSSARPSDDQPEPSASGCLVRAVTEAMQAEPRLEAVKIDRERGAISVATLGQPQHPDLAGELTARIQRLEPSSGQSHCALLQGAEDCAQCLEDAAQAKALPITIQREGESTTIARVTCPTAPRFWRWREVPWPRWVPREVVLPEEAAHEREWKWQLAAAAACGVCGLLGRLIGGPSAPWFYALAYAAGGWFTAHEVSQRLRKGLVDVHFLMLAVAAGSAAIGAWGEGAILLFLFSFSGALEHYAMGRTHREIRSLFHSAPKTATVLTQDGREVTAPVQQLKPGFRLLIKPGEQYPVDAEIVKGRTASDESTLTGEAVPVDKGVGDLVLGGTLNLWGGVEVVVTRPLEESALHKVIRLIQEAQHLKAPSQRFTDRFGTAYTYAILALCLGMFLLWWLAWGFPPLLSTPADKSAFYRAMTLLVVASPCALVLSIPSAILAAIAWGARRGVLFRGGAAVEQLAEIDVVAMDKTGTLTTGELQVARVESYPPGREREVVEWAYALERLSHHPLARAITRYGKQTGLPVLELEHFESITGLGLRATYEGQQVLLGRREWLSEAGYASIIRTVTPVEAGYSEVWVGRGELAGRLLLRDDLRTQSRALVQQLRARGLKVVVLTGDHQGAATTLKERLALEDVRAELKPEEKVAAIRAFAEHGHRVAMIGDGVNDAPSLAAAHVGVAMGARGADAALEQAEVILMHDRLENFLTAWQLSQRARRIIRQNLFLSLGTVVALVGLALFSRIPLTTGVIGHEGSTVLVVFNSLRLLLRR